MWSSKRRLINPKPPTLSGLSRKIATSIAALACLGVAMAAGPAYAACQKPDPLRIMIFAGSYPTMLTFIGQDAGFYKKNCLDVTLVPINSGPAGIAQLVTNGIQISDSTVDNVIIARSRGLKIKIVSDQSAANSYSLVASNKFATPHEKEGWPAVMKDFIGKRIGVYALGAGSQYMVRALFREAGLDPDKATYVAVGAPPTQLAALKNGAVDAVIMIAPGQDIAEAEHYGRVVVDLRKKGVGPKDIQALGRTFQVKVASDAFIKAHPDVMKRYLKANEETEAWIHDPANFPQLVKYLAKNIKIGKDVPDGQKLFSSLIRFWASVAVVGIDHEAIDSWIKFEVNSNNISKPISYSDVVWSGAPTMK